MSQKKNQRFKPQQQRQGVSTFSKMNPAERDKFPELDLFKKNAIVRNVVRDIAYGNLDYATDLKFLYDPVLQNQIMQYIQTNYINASYVSASVSMFSATPQAAQLLANQSMRDEVIKSCGMKLSVYHILYQSFSSFMLTGNAGYLQCASQNIKQNKVQYYL